MSVAAEKLAHPAIRCAEVLTELAHPLPVDRTGAGLCVEVYPAAALQRWGLRPPSSYKTGIAAATTRTTLLTGLAAACPWLDLDDDAERLRSSDHLIDALICAILARAVQSRSCDRIPPAHRSSAGREGWIHLPAPDSLTNLGAKAG